MMSAERSRAYVRSKKSIGLKLKAPGGVREEEKGREKLADSAPRHLL